MPANLTPEYDRADERYRQATTDDQKLDALRGMLSAIPKHKGTEKMQADLKRRISVLQKAGGRKGVRKGPDPFHIPKSGAGQVVLVGPPNVGKSMIVATTTNAHVKVADYPYTTALPLPGMWRHEDVQIQLVDTPPMTADHIPPGLIGTIRPADVIAVVVDAADAPLEQADAMLELLEGRGMTLQSVTRNELHDAEGNVYSGLLMANKVDLAAADDIETLRQLYADRLEVWPVSAASGEGLDGLLNRLWQLLSVIRVYTKQPGKPPDHDKPFTLPVGSSIEDLAAQIHRELPQKMRNARIWGDGRFDGQHVHRTEALHDKDVVEIHE